MLRCMHRADEAVHAAVEKRIAQAQARLARLMQEQESRRMETQERLLQHHERTEVLQHALITIHIHALHACNGRWN